VLALALGWMLATGSPAEAEVGTGASTVKLDCGPPVVVSQPAPCEVTVTDNVRSPPTLTPTGTVDFGATSEGTFTPSSCNLTESAPGEAGCTVKYDPMQAGEQTINASYAGDSTYAVSPGSAVLTVNPRATTLAVSCGPPVLVSQTATCTVTATDSDGAGMPSAPAGTVSFDASAEGTFSSSSCELTESAAAHQSSCSVNYTPTQVGSGIHKLAATYPSDAVHAGSRESAMLTVGAAPTQPSSGGTTTTTTPVATAPVPAPSATRIAPRCVVRAKERWTTGRRARPRAPKLQIPELVVNYTCDQDAAVRIAGVVKIAPAGHGRKRTKGKTINLATVSSSAVLGKASPGTVLALPSSVAKALRAGVRTSVTVTFIVKNAKGSGIGIISFRLLPPPLHLQLL
jgi:Bacterial Ig-like domain (group 3)